jgi:hypothetical protein
MMGQRAPAFLSSEPPIRFAKRCRGLYLLSHVGPYRLEYTGAWGKRQAYWGLVNTGIWAH